MNVTVLASVYGYRHYLLQLTEEDIVIAAENGEKEVAFDSLISKTEKTAVYMQNGKIISFFNPFPIVSRKKIGAGNYDVELLSDRPYGWYACEIKKIS